jgi:hypothetical protein
MSGSVPRYRQLRFQNQRKDNWSVRQIYVWAFVVRALAGVAAYVLTQTMDTPFLEDALWYEYMGYNVASDWLSGGSGGLDALSTHGQAVWVMVATVAVIYYIMGGVRAVPVLLILYSAVTALVPVYSLFIGRELGMSEQAARRAAWLVALSPAFVFWSGSLYKEGMILLALNVLVYHTLRLQSRWQGRSLAILVMVIGALFGLRFYIAAVMTAVVGAGLLWARQGNARRVTPSVAMPTIARQAIVAVLFVALVASLGLHEKAERQLTETREGILLEVDKTRHWLATSAQSGYYPDADLATPQEAVEFFPIGLFYFLTVPLPWQTGALRQNLIIPETAFWLLLYPVIGIGFVRGWRVNRPGTMVCVAATAGMCIIYALVSGNVGIAYRMRSQVWLLWAPFAAWGWEVWRERRYKATAVRLAARRARVERLGAR